MTEEIVLVVRVTNMEEALEWAAHLVDTGFDLSTTLEFVSKDLQFEIVGSGRG